MYQRNAQIQKTELGRIERNMKWQKFTLTTTTEAVDLVSSMFDEIGIAGIEIEDNVPLTEAETKGMFRCV